MKILFVGSKDRGVACLEALLDVGHEIIEVVTNPGTDPDAFWDGSVAEAAEDRGIPVSAPSDINDRTVIEKVRRLEPDLIVLSGYNQILGPEILSIPDEGVINLHAGKLPEYRGGSPMNWAIINGETSGTATIHYATERVDAGDVLLEREFPIATDDTIADVRERTLALFPGMLVEVIERLEAGTTDPAPIDISEGVYWCSRHPQDGLIRWEAMTAKEVYDFVRALTHPYPGAYTFLGNEKLFVWEASLMDDDVRHSPGRVCMRRGAGHVVAAKNRGVLVETVQPEGGDIRPASECVQRGAYLG